MSETYKYIVKVKDSKIFGSKTLRAKTIESARMIADTCLHSEIIKIDNT